MVRQYLHLERSWIPFFNAVKWDFKNNSLFLYFLKYQLVSSSIMQTQLIWVNCNRKSYVSTNCSPLCIFLILRSIYFVEGENESESNSLLFQCHNPENSYNNSISKCHCASRAFIYKTLFSQKNLSKCWERCHIR